MSWRSQASPIEAISSDANAGSLFPISDRLNDLVYFSEQAVTLVDVDAIVIPNNEKFNERTGISK